MQGEANLRYATTRYEAGEGDRQLNLFSFDGTYRCLSFASDEGVAAALMPGRAEADCIAIESGILPVGATFATAARAAEAASILAPTQSDANRKAHPLEEVRLKFSQSLLIARSAQIDEARSAQARQRHADDARRYESLVAAITQAASQGGLH